MIQGVLENKNLKDILKAVVSKYLYLKVVGDEGMEQCERYDRAIESFSPYNRKIFLNSRQQTYQECFNCFDFQFLK